MLFQDDNTVILSVEKNLIKRIILGSMFTGIITDIGTIESIKKDGGLSAIIKTKFNMDSVDIGASIACSGVCLTVVEKTANTFSVDISEETVNCTNVGSWKVGTQLNLERAMQLGDEFGGHIVSGHVDGLARLESISQVEASHVMEFSAPDNLAKFIAEKGSITLDGVSLTVNKVNRNKFGINIIPHTFEQTTFSELSVGCKINLEIDMLARYVSRALEYKNNA